jgi:asparagine synthase (glutamine-hydrolysing)
MLMSRYWRPETLLESARLSEPDVSATFERLMTQAVARSLAGNPVISLSGGIDSPTLAAFAAPEHTRATGRPLAALATVYPNLPSVDESMYVQMIADFLGLQLFTCERKAKPFVSLRDWAALIDGPIPRLWLADAEEHYREARQLGFTTMLTGEVAEFVVDIRAHIIPHLLWRGRFKPLWRNLEASRARGTSIRRLGWDLASTFLPGFVDTTYVRFWGIRHRPRIPDWVSARMVNAGRAQSLAPVRHRWRDFQLSGFSGPGLSVEANEVCQMVCGIRVRMPWSDVDLWEFFLSLPAEIKHPYPRRKALIRQLLRGRLPDAILDRRDKSGFEASMIERFDYDAIHRWVINQPYRMPGIDYRRLAEHLERRDFDIVDIRWASDLANVHAFLSLW